MEQILNKLSEIELTAQHIMEDCNQTKQQLSAEAEKKLSGLRPTAGSSDHCPDPADPSETGRGKDTRLSALRAETEATFSALDTYYDENHVCLSKRNFSRRSWNCKKHC